jgi:hypothetical protein
MSIIWGQQVQHISRGIRPPPAHVSPVTRFAKTCAILLQFLETKENLKSRKSKLSSRISWRIVTIVDLWLVPACQSCTICWQSVSSQTFRTPDWTARVRPSRQAVASIVRARQWSYHLALPLTKTPASSRSTALSFLFFFFWDSHFSLKRRHR